MEQTQSSELFSLTIDPVTKTSLSETAKWSRFLAIVGMIFLGLAVIGVLYMAYVMSSVGGIVQDTEAYRQSGSPFSFAGLGIGMALFYIIMIAVWFFPLMYLLRFANRMKVALRGNDQQALNISFQNLKSCMKFVGVVTIIILAVYAIVIIFAVIGLAAL